MKINYLLLLSSLILLLNLNLVKPSTVYLNADSCVSLACAFSSLFGGTPPSSLDDVIVKTTNSAVQAIVNLSDTLTFKSLNVTSGILRVVSGGSLTVSSNIVVGSGSLLTIETNGASSCQSLVVNTGGSISISGSLSIKNSLSFDSTIASTVTGSIKINGSLSLPTINFNELSPIPNIYGNAVITLSGNSNFLSGLTLSDNSQIINKATCIVGGLLTSSSNSIIHNYGTLNIGSAKSITNANLTCALKLDSNSITNIINTKCNVNNIGLITPTAVINLSSSSILSIFNQNGVTFGPINIDATSSMIFDNTNCIINYALSVVKGSLIHLKNKAIVRVDSVIDFVNSVNIENTANLIVGGTTSTFSGIVNCAVGSILTVANGNCIFKSPIIIDTLNFVDKATTSINVVSNVTINNGLKCSSPYNTITIDSVIGSLNIGGNSNLNIVLNLAGKSQFNVINKGVCIINQLVPIEQSVVKVFQGSNLTVTSSSVFKNPILLHGDSIVQFNADATLNGLTVFPIDKLNLPTIHLHKSSCKLSGSIDSLGSFNLVNSVLSLDSNVVLNINNNLISDALSNIVLPFGANLIVSGSSSVISHPFSIDGQLNIEKGGISFTGGLNTSSSSMISCNNANVVISASSNFSGPISVDGTGSIDIDQGEIHFLQGIQIPTSQCPVNIRKFTNVHIHSASDISSPIYCLNNSTFKVAVAVNPLTTIINLNGGISSDIGSSISIDKSIISLNSTSNIQGSVILNESSFISCGITNLLNGIESFVKGVEGNNTLMVNSGSCSINTPKPVELSGSINVMAKSLLSIRAPKTTCYKGIKNSGKLIVGSIVDLNKSIISQLDGDASIELIHGSNIIAKSANFVSGQVTGYGNITINGDSSQGDSCKCGGILGGWISIDGKLELLESNVLKVLVMSNTNVSKITCTNGATIINGLIDVSFDSDSIESSIKIGTIFPILSSSISISGNLSLSDTSESKQFACKPPTDGSSASEYSLIYQQTNVPSNKGASSIGEKDNSSNSNSLSINYLLLLLISIFISLYLL